MTEALARGVNASRLEWLEAQRRAREQGARNLAYAQQVKDQRSYSPADYASSAMHGFNRALGGPVDFANLLVGADRPIGGSQWFDETFNRAPKADDRLGRGLERAGENLGYTVPVAGLLGTAARFAPMVGPAAKNLWQGVTRSMVAPVQAAPGTAAIADVAGSTAGGLLSSYAPEGWEVPADILGDVATSIAIGGIPVVASRRGQKAIEQSVTGMGHNVPDRFSGALAPTTMPVRGRTSVELAGQQQQLLTPNQLDQLDALKASNPAFAEAADFVSPREMSTLLQSPDAVNKFTRLLEVMPNAEQMTSLMKVGAPKRGWYRASSQALVDIFGTQDAPRFATLLASTSPQTSVESNLINSLNIWKNWTAAGRPTDPRAIKQIMGVSVQGTGTEASVMDAWFHNTVRALSSADPSKTTLSGPKVDSFFGNLADDVYRVTNDAWMSNVAQIDQTLLRVNPTAAQLASGNPGFSPGYSALSARTRQGAQNLGWFPDEGQETAWSAAMPLMEMQTNTGMPAREILQKNLLTPDVVRGTPDFSSLLHDNPLYAGVLREAGYGKQVDALRPYDFPRSVPEMTLQDQNNMMAIAEGFEDLGRMRDVRSRSSSVGWRAQPEDTVMAYTNFEGIPGLGTGIAEDLIDAPQGTRDYFSGRIAGASRDPQQLDIIQRGLGLNVAPTRTGTGSWRGKTDRVMSAPAEVPTVRGATAIDPGVEQRIIAGNTLRGGMLGQLGTPHNAIIRDPAGMELAIRRGKDKKLEPQGILRAMDDFGERIAIADTGSGAIVRNFGDEPFTVAEQQSLAGYLDALPGKRDVGPYSTGVGTARSVADPDRAFVDLSEEFGAGEGSRAVYNRMKKEIDAVEPHIIENWANNDQDLRGMASNVIKLYERRVKKGSEVRGDWFNMLKIISEKGLRGLLDAGRDPKQILPALLVFGAGGSILRDSPQAPGDTTHQSNPYQSSY